MFRFCLSLLLSLVFQMVLAGNPDTLALLPAVERLKLAGDSLLGGRSDSTRMEASAEFERLCDSILRLPAGPSLSFYQVKALSVTVSEDQNIRLYNWMLMLDRGNSYRYFGYVAARAEKKMPYRIYRLREKKYTDNEAVSMQKLDSSNWLGCVYYKLIHERYDKKDYYVALGWAPQSLQTTRKIIEPLVVSPNKVTLGAPVLKAKGTKAKMRAVFEYNARATMSLRYEEKNSRIVFDHLAPSDTRPESKGVYSMYGPDLSYDGYQFEKGSWIFRPDLELNNRDLNEGKEGKFFGR